MYTEDNDDDGDDEAYVVCETGCIGPARTAASELHVEKPLGHDPSTPGCILPSSTRQNAQLFQDLASWDTPEVIIFNQYG